MNQDAEIFGSGSPSDADQVPSFPQLLRQFNLTIEAVLEVLETVSPHVATLDKGSNTAITLPPLTEGGAKVLGELFDGFSTEWEESGNDSAETPEEPKTLTNQQAQDLAEALIEAYDRDPRALRAVGDALTTISARPRREPLLHGALLTMAVGTLETAIAGVGTQHYSLHPEALPSSEKEFSLAELAAFEDLRDARALAISRRVDDLMRGGFDAWDSWFSQLLGEGFDDLAADRSVLHEAIQRRHLVVHNGGRVSRQYQAKVPLSEAKIGNVLPLDRDYVEAAIDAITIFGVRLILVAWSKWLPEDEAAAEMAVDFVFEQLVANRLEVARCIAQTAKGFAQEDQQRLSLQITEWQAEKRLKGVDEIRTTIECWDTSALSPRYAAAKAALLDDFDELFALLPTLLDHGELPPSALRGWPLFKEARERDEWSHIEAMLPPVDANSEEDQPECADTESGDPSTLLEETGPQPEPGDSCDVADRS